MGAPRWPRLVLIAGGVFAVALVAFLFYATHGAWRVVGLALPAVLTYAASVTAIGLLVAAVIAGMLRAPSLGESLIPRVVVGSASAGVAAVTLAVISYGARDVMTSVAFATGLASAAASAAGFRRPWPSGVAILALVAVVAAVDAARELGILQMSAQESRTRTTYELREGGIYEAHNANGRTFVGGSSDAVVRHELDGDIGELLSAAGYRERVPAPLAADLVVTGRVDMPWTCWVPLYKHVSVSASLELRGPIRTSAQRCDIRAPVELDIDYRAWGIQSCRTTRQQVRDVVAAQIRQAVLNLIRR